MMEYVLFKDLDGKYTTMNEYLEAENPTDGDADKVEEKTEEKTEEKADSDEKETPKTTIYYVTDEIQQSQYINMFREQKMNAVILKDNIDNPFISHLHRYAGI